MKQKLKVSSVNPIRPNYYRALDDSEDWIDVIDKFGLDWFQGTIVTYLARHRGKGGVEDLEKAREVLDRYIEFEKKKGEELKEYAP